MLLMAQFVLPCHQLTGKQQGLCGIVKSLRILAEKDVPEELAAIPMPPLFFASLHDSHD